MNYDQWLQANGFDPATISAGQRILLEGVWRQQHGTSPAPAPRPEAKDESSYEAVVSKAEAETARRKEITTLASDYLTRNPEMVAQLKPVIDAALQGGWTKEQLELQLYRASMPAGPHVHVPTAPRVSDEVVEAAVCRAAGMGEEQVEKSFGDEVLSSADRHYRGGCGLQRLLVEGARSHGLRAASAYGREDIRATLRAAFRRGDAEPTYGMTSGPSTISVSTILSNVGNKFSKAAYDAVENFWSKVAASRPVTDFKQVTTVALTGDLTYRTVGAGGEIKHGQLGEESWTNKAELYAVMIGLDYKQIRNDDLNVFARVNAKMGRNGALKVNAVFWKEFMRTGGTPFWSAGNGNYRGNADVAFGLAGLKKAHELVGKQTDPDGNPLGSQARYLVVPRSLELAAEEAMSSTLLGRDDEGGTRNVLAGKYEVVSPSELDNENFEGHSADDYYLVRDPADVPVIEICWLDGQQRPVIEEADADFAHLGIMVRAYHAFGAARQDTRGGYKFSGN